MLYTFFQSFLIVIWFLSGILKLYSMSSFIVTVEKITGNRNWSRLAGYALPIVEIAFSLCLLLEAFLPVVWYGSLALLTLFLVINVRVVVLKQDLACNCFGQTVPDQFGAGSLIKLLLLIGITVYLMLQVQSVSIWNSPYTIDSLLLSIGLFCSYALLMAYRDFRKKWQPI